MYKVYNSVLVVGVGLFVFINYARKSYFNFYLVPIYNMSHK